MTYLAITFHIRYKNIHLLSDSTNIHMTPHTPRPCIISLQNCKLHF